MIAGAVVFYIEGAHPNIPYSFRGLSGAEHKFAWNPKKARHEVGPYDPADCNRKWFQEFLQSPIAPITAQVELIEYVQPQAPTTPEAPTRPADPAPVAKPKTPGKRRPRA